VAEGNEATTSGGRKKILLLQCQNRKGGKKGQPFAPCAYARKRAGTLWTGGRIGGTPSFFGVGREPSFSGFAASSGKGFRREEQRELGN